MSTLPSPSPELSFGERVLETVLLSPRPLCAREVTASLYPEVSKVRVTNVRRTLHELSMEGRITCLEGETGRRALTWTAPLAVSAD